MTDGRFCQKSLQADQLLGRRQSILEVILLIIVIILLRF